MSGPMPTAIPAKIDVPYILEQAGAHVHITSSRRRTGEKKNERTGELESTWEKGYLARVVEHWGEPHNAPNPDGKVLAQHFDQDRVTAGRIAVAQVAKERGIDFVRPSPESALQKQVDAMAAQIAAMAAAQAKPDEKTPKK